MSHRSMYSEFVMTMQRVEQRLRRVTAALDRAGISYAVVGGNAVAAWVAQVDPAAVRTTKDVDLLVRRDDLDPLTTVLEGLGLRRETLRDLVLFVDPDEPSRRSGIHLVWSGERVRPSYAHPAPDVTEASRALETFAVLDLPALVRMKLTSLRPIDRAHVADLLTLGLVDERVRGPLPADLRARLDEIAAEVAD